MTFIIQAISIEEGFCRIYAENGVNKCVINIPQEFLVKPAFSEDGRTLTTENLYGKVFKWDVEAYIEWL